MAVVAYTETNLKKYREDVFIVTWVVAGNTDTYQPYENPGGADRSVQMIGTFNGGTITMQGSNDAGTLTNYTALTDPQGNALSKTADAIEQISEITRAIRPAVTAGSPTSVTVSMLVRRPFK